MPVRHLITCTLVGLVVLFMLSSVARQVSAAPITFEFTGVWRDVILANGPVQPGDTFRGRFFYDPDAAVISFHRDGISGAVTDYAFGPGDAGIELNVTTATGIVTFRDDASAMTAEVMNNFSDGTAPPIDRFYLQSFPSALFPSLYERNVERFFIDLVDSGLTLVNSTALPTSLKVPSNGYAFVALQGGTTVSNLDYNAAGTLQTLTAILGGNKCPLGQGFWKNHPQAWPVTSLTLGSQTYTKTQLLTILTTPVRGDASLILAHQLIAAKLNIAHGSDPAPVSATITDDDSLLSQFGGNRLPYNIRASSSIGQQMVNDANVLDRYNNGDLTPACQP